MERAHGAGITGAGAGTWASPTAWPDRDFSQGQKKRQEGRDPPRGRRSREEGRPWRRAAHAHERAVYTTRAPSSSGRAWAPHGPGLLPTMDRITGRERHSPVYLPQEQVRHLQQNWKRRS